VDALALADFIEDEAGDVFAVAALSGRAENHRDKKRPVGRHR
jgi:hypothetical protein